MQVVLYKSYWMKFLRHIFFGLCCVMICESTIAQNRGGIKVFIENAEEDDIIGATVQVMDGERQVTGGVTDFEGFLYLPNIDAGRYNVVIRHIMTIPDTLPIRVKENEIFELKIHLELGDEGSQSLPILLSSDTEIAKTTDDVLRLPVRGPAAYHKGYCVCTPSGQASAPLKKTNAWEVDPKINLKSGLKVVAIDENGTAFFGAHVEALLLKTDVDSTVGNEKGMLKHGFRESAVTNIDGIAHIKDLPSGTYKVSISHVSLGGVRSFDITIKPYETFELKLERAFYKELPPLNISAGNDCREPFFDPYGQDKAKRSSIYFEMPPINK